MVADNSGDKVDGWDDALAVYADLGRRFEGKLVATLTFAECAALCLLWGKPGALQSLRNLRNNRLLFFGRSKGGKSTIVFEAAKRLGKLVVWSLDHDVTPHGSRYDDLWPLPYNVHGLPAFNAHAAEACEQAQTWLSTGAVIGVCLDTVTRLHTLFQGLAVMSDPRMMLDTTSQAAMQAGVAPARAALAVADQVFKLAQAASQSDHDGPFMFVVTEHAKSVTNAAMGVGTGKMDFTHNHWAPQIGMGTGEKILSQVDGQFGVSLSGKPKSKADYVIDFDGDYSGCRYTDEEQAILRKWLSTLDRDRLASALLELWAYRKIKWAKDCGFLTETGYLAPLPQTDGEESSSG